MRELIKFKFELVVERQRRSDHERGDNRLGGHVPGVGSIGARRAQGGRGVAGGVRDDQHPVQRRR
jgi:hypothetical protein